MVVLIIFDGVRYLVNILSAPGDEIKETLKILSGQNKVHNVWGSTIIWDKWYSPNGDAKPVDAG